VGPARLRGAQHWYSTGWQHSLLLTTGALANSQQSIACTKRSSKDPGNFIIKPSGIKVWPTEIR